MTSDDQELVAVQLGRPLRAPSRVAARCPLGLPAVVAVPPLLDDGTPFPTRWWLTCPLAARRIGRLESAGGVKLMDVTAAADPAFAARLAAAHRRYAAERDALVPEGAALRPRGGVAGSEGSVKCLHAHYADTLAGNDNPVGEMVARWVEPLDCTIACVTATGGEAGRNPEWAEPR